MTRQPFSLLLTHLVHSYFELIGVYGTIDGYMRYTIENNEILEFDNEYDYKQHIVKDLMSYRTHYKILSSKIHNDMNNPNILIKNYAQIISNPNYMQYELGYVVFDENMNQYMVIKTTCWLKIFQRKIKNIIASRKRKQRC